MKILVLFLLLSTTLLSQTYMNVLFSDASSKYADVDDVTEITFSGDGTEMTTTLSSGSSTDLVSNITEITFDGVANGGLLPVELTSFYATENNGKVLLNWTTATEINNYGFEIYRELSGLETEWENIGFVEGHGNSNTTQNYSFTDNSNYSNNVKYRLKQVDTDGTFEYSETIAIQLVALTKYALEQNYPNPFNPTTMISYTIPNSSHVSVKVFDILGNTISTLVNEPQEIGSYEVTFNASELSNGIYFYKMTAGKYSLVRKMILLK